MQLYIKEKKVSFHLFSWVEKILQFLVFLTQKSLENFLLDYAEKSVQIVLFSSKTAAE